MSRFEQRVPRCAHPAADDILLYVQGRLDAAARETLERHRAECEDCTERLETASWMHASVREQGESLFAEHVASEELVRYAEAIGELEAERRREIERHLVICDLCHADLGVLREVDLSADRPSRREFEGVAERPPRREVEPPAARAPHRAWWVSRPAPAWAYAALLVLAVPAVFGVRSWMAGPSSEPAVRSLPAPQLLESRSTRAGAERSVVRFTLGDPVVLEFHVPIVADGGARYDARIEGGEQEVVWSSTGLQSSDEFGSFLLIVDPGRLQAGPYRLVVNEVEKSTGQIRQDFEFPFTLLVR